MSYIGTTNKLVSCIYGPFNIVEGEEVPMLYAVKFPQYVTKIKDPTPIVEVIIEDPIVEENTIGETIIEDEEREIEYKNERKGRKL